MTRLKTASLELPRPTGTVTILDGSTAIATAVLDGGPVQRVPLARLSIGTHRLTARYSGDANYREFTFGDYTLVVGRQPSRRQ